MFMDPFGGMSKAVTDLKNAAANGGFSISEQGGRDLMNAIRGLQQVIDHALMKSSELSAELPIGSTPAANVYKPFFQTIADNHPQALMPALRKLYNDLQTAYDTIHQATGAYAATDQSSASGLNNAGGNTL